MVKISYKRYLLVNSFENNKSSMLKYYRRYEVEKFDEYIGGIKFIVDKKAIDKTHPLYEYQNKKSKKKALYA